MYTQEEINQLVIRLKDYYPNRAEEATQILLNEYGLPMPIAAFIMNLVKMLVEKNNCSMWPILDARTQPFYVN
jgi:hypothetical protein